MIRHLVAALGVAALISQVTSNLSAGSEGYEHGQPTKLRPISIRDYETALGLQRREEEDFSTLSLQKQAELIYGSPGDNGQLLLANMTLYAPDGLMMIMMERFEGLTSAVDCEGDDGQMSLTFSSQQAYDYALKQWSYINENEDGKFLLIANHDGCGADERRQPYFISKIIEDTAALTARLTAAPAPWSEVAGSYDLDFGHAVPYPNASSRVKPRGIWGDIVDVGKDALNAAQGNADIITKSVTIPMNIGQAGQKTNIYTDAKGRITLDCINCYVKGSFGVTGHVSVQHFKLQDLTLNASPNGIGAELELEAVVTSSESPDRLQFTKELFSFPVPSAGIEVPGIFELGAILSYDIGVSSTFKSSATVDFGLSAGLPDSAHLLADIQNPDQSSATGFSGGSLNPIFDIKKGSASITLAAFSQPKLSFGIELIDVGNVDVAITVKLPEVSVTLSAEYDDAGVCSQTAGSSQTGVKVDSKVDINVNLQIDANLGSDGETAKPVWSKELWNLSHPLGSRCFPMDIPGLNQNVSSSSASALPSTSAAASAVSKGASTTYSETGTYRVPTGTGSASEAGTGTVSASASLATGMSQPSGSSDTLSPPRTTSASGSLGGSDSIPAATGSSSLSSLPLASATSSKPPKSTTPTQKSTTPVPKSTTPTPKRTTTPIPDPTTTSKPDPTTTKKPSVTPKTTPTTSAKPKTTTSSAASSGGGGGCRMVKRFGKRMLVCYT